MTRSELGARLRCCSPTIAPVLSTPATVHRASWTVAHSPRFSLRESSLAAFSRSTWARQRMMQPSPRERNGGAGHRELQQTIHAFHRCEAFEARHAVVCTVRQDRHGEHQPSHLNVRGPNARVSWRGHGRLGFEVSSCGKMTNSAQGEPAWSTARTTCPRHDFS